MGDFSKRELQETLNGWPDRLSAFAKADSKKAFIQLATTFAAFFAVWIAMYYSLGVSIWLTIGLGILNGFMIVKIFIIQHDCGHRSYFSNDRMNHLFGLISSVFSTIPYKYWARVHAFHHGHCGQLETHEIGDIRTLTTAQFRLMSGWERLQYKIFRNTIVLFIIGPAVYILRNCRLPIVNMKGWKNIHWSLVLNNVLIFAVYLSIGYLVGWREFFIVQLTSVFFFAVIAVWFFYVQHQHEHGYHDWRDNWDYVIAAIQGSTFYKLSPLMHWMTGNIGYHHIHHLNSKIPSYNLPKVALSYPVINKFVTEVSLWDSFKYPRYKLWDESSQKMITFKEFYNLYE